MHPVARVSIKYWKTSVRNTVFFSARRKQLLLTNNYIILYFLYYIFIPFYFLEFAVLVLFVYVA
jgi:hypothetical protein